MERDPAAPAPLDPPSIRQMRHCLDQIVVVMCEKGLALDVLVSEIQDHLSIAGYDVPLRSYHTRGAVQAERPRAPSHQAIEAAKKEWRATDWGRTAESDSDFLRRLLAAAYAIDFGARVALQGAPTEETKP